MARVVGDVKAASSTWGETWTVPGRTVQQKGEQKKVAKKAPAKQPARTTEDGGEGPPQINIGIGGGGGERGRREKENRRGREGSGGVGSFGR